MRAFVVVGAILLAALGLRLGYVAVTPDYAIVHDARDYERARAVGRARRGLLGAVHGQADGVPAAGLRLPAR